MNPGGHLLVAIELAELKIHPGARQYIHNANRLAVSESIRNNHIGRLKECSDATEGASRMRTIVIL